MIDSKNCAGGGIYLLPGLSANVVNDRTARHRLCCAWLQRHTGVDMACIGHESRPTVHEQPRAA
jgi:hypothetical protein